MKSPLIIPLLDAERYYRLLIENDKTAGTFEQKMLVLRRRFDLILRETAGPIHSNEVGFYWKALVKLKSRIKPRNDEWDEIDRMREAFNTLMHGDIHINQGIYQLALARLSMLIKLISGTPIPETLNISFGSTRLVIQASKRGIPVLCCIDSLSIQDSRERDLFNAEAQRFRNDVLQNTRLKEEIQIQFIVSTESQIRIRDLSDQPIREQRGNSSPRESALRYAAEQLRGAQTGMLILFFGGKPLQLTLELESFFESIPKGIHIFPVALDTTFDTYGGTPLKNLEFRMIPGCYHEFFSWLYDAMTLLHQ